MSTKERVKQHLHRHKKENENDQASEYAPASKSQAGGEGNEAQPKGQEPLNSQGQQQNQGQPNQEQKQSQGQQSQDQQQNQEQQQNQKQQQNQEQHQNQEQQQNQGQQPNQAQQQNQDQGNKEAQGEIKIDPSQKPEEKEEDDLPLLLKNLEGCCKSGGDPNKMVDEWIAKKEKKLKRWRHGLKSGAGVQTFGLGLVTFGLGPIPVNMGIMASLNKHIVHVFTLDDQRVDHFVKSTLGYGAGSVAKKLGMMVAKSAVTTGSAAAATGVVPLIGPAVSGAMTAHKISKVGKETTAKCAELVREICSEAVKNNKFEI